MPNNTQQIIETLASLMADRYFEDQAEGITRLPSPEFLKKVQALEKQSKPVRNKK